MRYGSVCSGIEAATVAFHPLGWEPAFFSEIEAFPCSVLKHHYPTVPNHGDMTKFKDWPNHAIDILVGGTPCQSFSVAGLRKGLDDPRGNLTLTYLAIAARYRPEWVVWENVPGVLSDTTGAFASFLRGLAELGYGWAYRVLDAQYAGVPQRRRRVFVVGHLGDWRRAAAVLFERHSLQGHHPPSREARESVAGTLSARTQGGGGLGTDFELGGGLVPQGCGGEVAPTLNAAFGRKLGLDNQHVDSGAGLFVTHALRAEGFDASEDGTGRGTPLIPVAIQERAICENPNAGPDGASFRTDGQAYTLEARTVPQAVAFQEAQTGCREYELSGTLRANGPGHDPVGTRLRIGTAVRRLTPRECERLQGFPDDYTLVPHKGKPAADGPRYKALGNSMAVPVMNWIGSRIAAVSAL